jgi:hypothetical protein
MRTNTAPVSLSKTDPWGARTKDAAGTDGHDTWSCNNHRCQIHPPTLYGVPAPKKAPAPLTPDVASIGDIVIAAPWTSGEHLAPRVALVVAVWDTGDAASDFMIVWFYTLGAPVNGVTVQAVREATRRPGRTDYTFASLAQLRTWERAARQQVESLQVHWEGLHRRLSALCATLARTS